MSLMVEREDKPIPSSSSASWDVSALIDGLTRRFHLRHFADQILGILGIPSAVFSDTAALPVQIRSTGFLSLINWTCRNIRVPTALILVQWIISEA